MQRIYLVPVKKVFSDFDITDDRPAKRIQIALYEEIDRRHSYKELGQWQKKENNVLKNAVDMERSKLGKGPVDIKKVEKAVSCADGYIDYVFKVAMYCEELVYED